MFTQVVLNNGSAEFLLSTNSTFTVSPEFIGSRLLLKMKKMAEQHLGVPIDKAVISVPADFDERQRNYTIRAASLAGPSANKPLAESTLWACSRSFNPSQISLKGSEQDFLQLPSAFMIIA